MKKQGANTSEASERRFMDEKETAVLLRTTQRSLQQRRYRNAGPPYHKLGTGPRAKVVYDYHEVLAWVDSCKVPARAAAGA